METRTDDGPEPWFCEGPFPSWIHTGIFPLHRRRIRIRTIQLVLLTWLSACLIPEGICVVQAAMNPYSVASYYPKSTAGRETTHVIQTRSTRVDRHAITVFVLILRVSNT